MLSFGVVPKKISVIVKKISQIVFPFLVMYLCEMSFFFSYTLIRRTHCSRLNVEADTKI